MLELAQKYAALKKTKVITHRITGKEITFVLESGPKLTLTESQLKLAIQTQTDGVGTVADDAPPAPSAPSESAEKPRKTKKES